MSGLGTSTQQTSQQTSSSPGAAAQPAVNGLLGQLQGLIPSSGLNGAESGAINQLTANGQAGNQYAPAIGNTATSLLNGGGANAQAPNLQSGLSTLQSQLTPYANGSMVGNNPALQQQLSTLNSQITNQVNGQFAAAGRSGSGQNSEALGLGLTQGEAPVIANQYNQDVANQLSAANSLYGAQNTTSGALTGLNQQGLSNQVQGVQTANDALTAQNWGPQQILTAQELGQQLPAQNLGLLTQIGTPLASMYTNSTGTGNTTNNASPLQDIVGLGGMIGSSPNTSATGAKTGGAGLLGLLGAL